MPLNVLIGIHVHSRPDDLRETLRSVQRHAGRAFNVVLLPDGPDTELGAFLRSGNSIEQLPVAEPRGPAACFNRLVRHADASFYVLLESGSILAPGWWHYISHALAVDPSHGLAGPTTNRAWNEQCVFPDSAHDHVSVLQNAYVAARQYGRKWRTLAPLYSLADFCFVVSGCVVDVVGAADEAYGLGPCWEMDYSIRAARAGFRGVWAMGAYVHRLPQTERRAAKEEELFPHSRARYQDKFCSLKLTGKSDRYEPTCRGEFCEHFAPPAMIRIHEPLAGRTVSAVKTARVSRASCVMVTGGREAFLRQAILYFSRQDYPEKELVIVDDGPRDLSAELGAAGIRYLHVAPGLSIGEKRNRGCELATGEYIVQWDDDDWHGPGRLGRQVTPMLRGEADITALRTELVFDLEHWRFWTMSDGVHRRMFVEDVHGGTLAFRREIWDRGVRYPHTSLAEDAQFLRRAIEQGARLKRARNEGAFIYLRHGSNAWSFQCGREVDSRGWKVVPEPAHLRADRQFYLALRRQRRSVPSPACRSIRDPGGPRFHPNANGAG